MNWQHLFLYVKKGLMVCRATKNIDTQENTEQERVDTDREDHDACVITWNVNMGSAQTDTLRIWPHVQGLVVVLHETQNWKEDNIAAEL